MSAVSLLTLSDAQLAFGDLPLLDCAAFTLLAGERVGLIGRNGTGKSSMLGVIQGRFPLDDGLLQKRDGLRIAAVEQEPELPQAESMHDSLLLRGGLEDFDDERERWRVQARLAEYMQRFGLNPDASPTSASGGERKRAALSLAVALEPVAFAAAELPYRLAAQTPPALFAPQLFRSLAPAASAIRQTQPPQAQARRRSRRRSAAALGWCALAKARVQGPRSYRRFC
jgi:ABC-type glutathione transport system ATPase component